MPNMVCRCSEGKKEGSGRLWLRPSRLLLPAFRYCATKNAVRCDAGCSVLHFPSHGKAVLRGGFLSIQAFGFLLLPHPFGKVLSVSFFMRVSAFCCAGLCVLLRGPFVFSCASLCLLLRGSELSLVRFSAFSCAVLCILLRKPMAWQVWVAAVEMAWGWDCGAWGCGPGLPGWRVRGNRQVL